MTEMEMLLHFPIGTTIRPTKVYGSMERNWLLALYGETWRVVGYSGVCLIAQATGSHSGSRFLNPTEWVPE
jgi:hypothetical protein